MTRMYTLLVSDEKKLEQLKGGGQVDFSCSFHSRTARKTEQGGAIRLVSVDNLKNIVRAKLVRKFMERKPDGEHMIHLIVKTI